MYLVIEMQKSGDTLSAINYAFNSQNEAESKYHALLSVAAVSDVPVHSAVMLSEEGFPMRNECYKHTSAAVEE